MTVLWAGNFTAGKFATAEFDWRVIAAIRILLAGAIFPLFLRADDRRDLLRPSMWRLLFPLAITGIFINQFAFAAGIHDTTPGHSALMHALIPVFVMIIAFLFHSETPGSLALAGMALAVGGAIYLILAQTPLEGALTMRGDLLTLLGALAFSAYIVIGRRVIPQVGSYKAVSLGFAMASPISVPLLIWGLRVQDWGIVTSKGVIGLSYMIVAATFICYSLHMWAVGKLGALRTAVFTNLQPILGSLIALAFGAEKPTQTFVIAAIVIVGGVVLVQASPSKPRDSK